MDVNSHRTLKIMNKSNIMIVRSISNLIDIKPENDTMLTKSIGK